MTVLVKCTDEHKDSEGHRSSCKWRKDGLCTKPVLHIRLIWVDDAYMTHMICADQTEER
jgi:hypothetical protein